MDLAGTRACVVVNTAVRNVPAERTSTSRCLSDIRGSSEEKRPEIENV